MGLTGSKLPEVRVFITLVPVLLSQHLHMAPGANGKAKGCFLYLAFISSPGPI